MPNTLRMNLRSVYQTNFSGAPHPPAETGKHPDSLRGGLPWTGGSTYRQLFKGTAPSLPREAAGRAERRAEDPVYLHQYGTPPQIQRPPTATSICWGARSARGGSSRAIPCWSGCRGRWSCDLPLTVFAFISWCKSYSIDIDGKRITP